MGGAGGAAGGERQPGGGPVRAGGARGADPDGAAAVGEARSTTRIYPALLIRDAGEADDAPIGVVFPDLPGCVSQGDGPRHAAEMAMEALPLHVGAMAEDGDPLPEPSPPGTVPDWLDPGGTEAVTTLLVPVELPGRSVRVNITMDENLLQRADRAAVAQGMTRSGLLAEAVRTWLRRDAEAARGGKRRRAS